MKPTPLIGIALACLVGVAGCNRADEKADRSAAAPQGSTAQQSGGVAQAVDDTSITAKVKAELLAKSDVNGTDISVDTKQGQVTLSGTVPPAQIARAEEIARKVDGVREVVNQLKPATASS
jgi:hyperosmotically inducible periplasmic protein